MTSKNIFSEIVKDLSTYSERDIIVLAKKWSIPFVNKSQTVNVIAYKIFSDNFSNIGRMKSKYESSSSSNVNNDEEVKEAFLKDDLEGLVGRDPARYILSKYLKDPKDLLNAIKSGKIELVNYFLSLGMEVQPQKYFDAAIESENIEMVKLIMSQRNNSNIELNEALKVASSSGHMDIVNYLKNKIDEREIQN